MTLEWDDCDEESVEEYPKYLINHIPKNKNVPYQIKIDELGDKKTVNEFNFPFKEQAEHFVTFISSYYHNYNIFPKINELTVIYELALGHQRYLDINKWN